MNAESADGRTLWVNGQERLAFCGCDYLGLAHHPKVTAAAVEEIGRSGLSASAARETTGTHRAHVELESALADWLGCEAAALVADGYLADLALLEALPVEGQVGWIDREAHASLFAALRLAGVEARTYAGELGANDLEQAALLATDGVYPLLARTPPLDSLRSSLPANAWLIVDDSHGLGVLGEGRGSLAASGITDRSRVAVTSSLAKALGVGGGVIAGPAALIEEVRTTGAYATTTPMAPALARAVHASLRCIADDPGLLTRLADHTRWLAALAGELGLGHHLRPLPVLGIVPVDAAAAERIRGALIDAGIHARFVDYRGDTRPGAFRIVLRVPHTDEDRERLAGVLRARQADVLVD